VCQERKRVRKGRGRKRGRDKPVVNGRSSPAGHDLARLIREKEESVRVHPVNATLSRFPMPDLSPLNHRSSCTGISSSVTSTSPCH